MIRLSLILSLLTLCSCATTFGDRNEKIPVTSSPAGAQATLACADGTTVSGLTPATLEVRATATDCQLRITTDGYEPRTVVIGRGINGAFWGNFGFSLLAPAGAFATSGDGQYDKPLGFAMIAGAILPFYIDYRSGAMHKPEPNSVDVVLIPKP